MGKIELKKIVPFKVRGGNLSLREKKIGRSLYSNINETLKNSLPKHTFAKRQIKDVSMQVVSRFLRADKDNYKQLLNQGLISNKELSALKRQVPFTPFNLIERLGGILLDCYYNKISFSNILLLARKFMPLEYVIELKDKYDISFCDTMRFVRTHKEPEEALKRDIPLAKRLAEKYNISPYYGMRYVKYYKHQSAEETLKKAINLAKRLAEKYKITFPNAFFFVSEHGYTKAEEELNNAVCLAKRLKEKYKVSLHDAMYYVKRYGYENAEVTLKIAIDLAKRLMKKYDISFYDSFYFVMQYNKPEKALRRAVYLAKRLARKYEVSFYFAIFHVKRYGSENSEAALKNTIHSSKILEKDYDISFYDAMKVTMTHKNPQLILNRMTTIRAWIPMRNDLSPYVYNSLIKASIFKDNYLEAALNLSRKLNRLVDELKKVNLPLSEAIAQLSLLHGSLLGTLLIQAFGGPSHVRKADAYDELELAYHALFYENVKYPGVDNLTPLDKLMQKEEVINIRQRAQRIRHLFLSALPEKDPERKIQTEILLRLLSGDLDLDELTKELNITLEKVAENTSNLFAKIKNDPRIEKELRDLDFFRD